MKKSVFTAGLCFAGSILVLSTFSRNAAAFGEAACGDTGIEDTLFSETGSMTQAGGYSNTDCYKAYVIDVDDLQLGSSGTVNITWDDTLPTTEEACKDLWMGVDVYIWDVSLWAQVETNTANGQWYSFGGSSGWCVGPGFSLGSLANGDNYRFAISARTSDTSGAPTQAFSFSAEP